MSSTRSAAVLVVTVLVATAGLPLAVVTVPSASGGGGGVAAAQTAPVADCRIVGEQYPEVGELVELNASETTGAELVEFDRDGDGTEDRTDDTEPFAIRTEYSSGTYEPQVTAVNGSANDTADCGRLVVAENTPPSGNISVDTSPLVVGDVERFLANASDDDGSVEEYEWAVDGQFVTTGSTLEYQFGGAGNHTVNLTLTDNDGAQTTVSRTVTVLPSEPPEAALSANRSTLEPGDTVAFDASNATDDEGIISYEWDVDGDGTAERTTGLPRLDWTYETVPTLPFNATVEVVDGDGQTDTASVTFREANEQPTADISYFPAEPSVGELVTFEAEASDPDGTIERYSWLVNGDRLGEGPGFEYEFPEPGEYNVSLQVFDDDGASTTTSVTVTVNVTAPIPRVETNGTALTAPGVVAFDGTASSDPDGNVTDYLWDFDGDNRTDATGPTAAFRYTAPGNYTAALTVVDDDGFRNATAVPITVREANPPPTAVVGANRTIVTGNSSGVALSAANSTDDGSITSYAWDLDGDGTTDTTGPTAIASFPRQSSARTVIVTLTVTDDDGGTDTARLRISVAANRNQPPTAAFAASPPAPKPTESVVLDATPSSDTDGRIARYAWDLDDDGTVDTTGATVTRPASAIGPDVRLTVADDEGATDTATRTIQTQGTTLQGNGTLTVNISLNRTVPVYVNSPPNPSFTATPSRPEPGESVRFESTSYDLDGKIMDYKWYLDGSQVSDGRTCGPNAPRGCIPVQDFRPSDVSLRFDRAGNYSVKLVVTDDDGTSASVAKTIQVEQQADAPTASFFRVRSRTPDPSPNALEVGEALVLRGGASTAVGNRSITKYRWTFAQQGGPGFITASGNSVSLGLPDNGTWTVTLTVTDSTGETDSLSRNYTVSQRGETPRISNVTQTPAGKPLSIVPMQLTYEVNVIAADSIRKVTFRRGGQTFVDTNSANGWTHTLDPANLSSDQRMSVTVTDVDGQSDTETVSVDLNEPPQWARAILTLGSGTNTLSARNASTQAIKRSVTVRTNAKGQTVVVFDFTLDPIGFTKKIETGFAVGPVASSFAASGRVVYNMSTQIAYFTGSGSAQTTVNPIPVQGGVSVGGSAQSRVNASGLVDTQGTQRKLPSGVNCPVGCSKWKIKRAVSRGNASYSVKATIGLAGQFKQLFPKVPDWIINRLGPKATLKGTWGMAVTAIYRDRGGVLTVTDGQFRPFMAYQGKITEGIPAATLSGTARGFVKGFIPDPPRSGKEGLLARFILKGTAKAFGKKTTAKKVWTERIGNTNILKKKWPSKFSINTLAVDGAAPTVESSGWQFREKDLGDPPGSTTTARPLGLEAAPQAVTGTDRLTVDTTIDQFPAVAVGNGTYTAVWTRQNPAKNVSDGFDIYTSRSATGASWSLPATISDDRTIEVRPAVGATGTLTLAAWSRVTAANTTGSPFALFDDTELTYAVRDSTGWSTPVVLTDDNVSDLGVTVAGTDGRFLVAWVSDPSDLNTTADREVRYAVSDGTGTLGQVRTVPNATAVAVAGDDGAFALAYLESDDGTNGTVVHATVATDGTRSLRDRYPVRGFSDLAVAGDELAWIAGGQLRFVDDGTVQSLSTGSFAGARDLGLVLDGGTPILTYRAVPPGSTSPQAVTQRRGPDGWLAPRRLTAGTPTGLSVLQAGTAAGADGVVSVAAARNISQQSNADIFAVRREFAPDLDIDVSTDADLRNTSAGDRITVNYTVENVGDRAVTQSVPVTLSNASGTVATATVAPLDVGEAASGSIRTQVDTGGVVALQVDPGSAVGELNESNNRATLVTARPDLAVGAITERRNGSRLVVDVAVRNRGPVAVAGAVVQLRSNGVVASRSVDVRPNGSRTIRLRVPVDAINRSTLETVVVDPRDRIAERAERNNRGVARLLGVDLAIASVGRTGAPNGSLADVFVANADTGDATANVTIDAGGVALSYDLSVGGASTPQGRRFERVRLYAPATGGTLNVTALPVAAGDGDVTDNVGRTTVTVSANATAPVRVGGVTASLSNGTATLTVTLATDAGVPTGVPVTVAAGGTTLVETTAVVPANDTRTIELNATTSASTLTVATPGSRATATLAAAPDVNNNGQPATDTDGDGVYEDINGDGGLTIIDIAIFLDRFGESAVQTNVALFDFNGDNKVNIVDVAALLDQT